MTIRATDASLFILRICTPGATYEQVVSEVTRKWPTVPERLVRGTLLEMVRLGFLVTDLVPDSSNGDPIGHLLGRLPEACSLREPLTRLRNCLLDADRHAPGAPDRLSALKAARTLCDKIAHHDRPLSVDVAADAHLVLPASLADEAAEAVGLLWRVSHARDPLQDYHTQFLDRYGPHRFVPFLDVADPTLGLGEIDGETDIDTELMTPEHVAVLATLLSDAIAHGRTEVTLDTATIDTLDRHQVELPPPPTAEAYVRVLAASEEELAAGRFHLALYGGGTQQAGSTMGRFLPLLPDAEVSTTTVPTSPLVAELVVRPRSPELASVAPPTGFASIRIPIGVPAKQDDLDLDELLLVSTGSRLVLWSANHNRPVLPVLYSRIGPHYLPPVARLLQQLGLHGCRPWYGWSWGPLDHAPFQPRVRYKRTVLAPARWRLPATLTTMVRDSTRWYRALDAWRTTTVPPPPDIVVTDDADRQLPLDLRRMTDRELLRRYVRRGVVAVMEQPGGPDSIQAVVSGTTGQHVLELVVPLECQVSIPTENSRSTAVVRRPIGEGLYLPGSQWLSLAIASPGSNHDEILAELARLTTDIADQFDRWFWLRYNNSTHGPHLRIRFHGDPAVLGSRVLPAVSVWCSELIAHHLASRLTVEPYDQEIERYGGPAAMCAAERVFDADSRLVLATLAATSGTDQRLLAAALSAATIARSLADGSRVALDGRHVDRAAHRRLTELRPLVRAAAENDSAIIPPTHPAWVARQAALAAYRDNLPTARHPDCASSLIHMHANRLLGDLETERMARALAADILAREAR